MLGESAQKRIAELKNKFPKRKSAILPAMHVVLNEVGYYNSDPKASSAASGLK